MKACESVSVYWKRKRASSNFKLIGSGFWSKFLSEHQQTSVTVPFFVAHFLSSTCMALHQTIPCFLKFVQRSLQRTISFEFYFSNRLPLLNIDWYCFIKFWPQETKPITSKKEEIDYSRFETRINLILNFYAWKCGRSDVSGWLTFLMKYKFWGWVMNSN